MRYPADQKVETHQRIIDTAAQAFRERGFDGLGIAELMQESGLTQGGFYRHFDSKEDLYADAVTRSLEQVADKLAGIATSAPDGRSGRAIIEFYLSAGHLESVGAGCVIAALAPEIQRQPDSVRAKIDSAMQRLMNRLAPFFSGKTEAERRRNVYLLISGMAGVVMTVRAMTDAKIRRELLVSAREFYAGSFAKEE